MFVLALCVFGILGKMPRGYTAAADAYLTPHFMK